MSQNSKYEFSIIDRIECLLGVDEGGNKWELLVSEAVSDSTQEFVEYNCGLVGSQLGFGGEQAPREV